MSDKDAIALDSEGWRGGDSPPPSSDDPIIVVGWGLVYLTICAPNAASISEIEATANWKHPTGIESTWQLSDDPTFANGMPNPCPCERTPGRTHYLLNC